jgi:peptidoglycan hydrolase CwlO-like protein
VRQSTQLLFVLASSLAFQGCYLNSRGLELEQQIIAVEAWQEEFRLTFAEERQNLTELALQAEQNISELEAALNQAQDFLSRTNADLGVRVDELEGQLSELRGRLEESAFQSSQLRQELDLLRQDIEIQLSNLVD